MISVHEKCHRMCREFSCGESIPGTLSIGMVDWSYIHMIMSVPSSTFEIALDNANPTWHFI